MSCPQSTDLMLIGAAARPGRLIKSFSGNNVRGWVAAPSDLVGTTTYLAAKGSDDMTGQIETIDGGMTLV